MLYQLELFQKLMDRNTPKFPELKLSWFRTRKEFCPECGSDLYDEQKFCDNCGQRLKWDINGD